MMGIVAVIGTGKIGRLLACLLIGSGSYEVHLIDLVFSSEEMIQLTNQWPQLKLKTLDVQDESSLVSYLKTYRVEAVISSLPYFLNPYVAKAAKAAKTHYFDLTEDISVTKCVKKEAQNATKAFVPQCGLAPGFVSIVANNLIKEFDECHHAKLRVGALPQHTANALHYALTWSTDGLVNEYSNPCHAVCDGKIVMLNPLDGLENIQIDGASYEAFNTSGGLGSLAELWKGQLQSLNYKTMRYPGHAKKMRFLLQDLRLSDDKETLKIILEKALPKTTQDIVIIYVSVQGLKAGSLFEKSYVKKIYPRTIYGMSWSAIQISTAAGLLAVMDLIFEASSQYSGLVFQESFQLEAILNNRFGQYFKGE